MNLFDTLAATWPPARSWRMGPFTLRDGAGGGQRVSAATCDGPWTPPDLEAAERAMPAPLFQVRGDQPELDAALEARGYAIKDPTILMQAPTAAIAAQPRPVSLLHCWPPLAIQRQMWAAGGIGPSRIAVMARARDVPQSFIARHRNRAAGVAFLAIHEGTAMIHALEIEPEFRRQGVARWMMTGMAYWAQGQGAQTLSLAVTQANAPARALYTSLGMTDAGRYHYRARMP